MLRINLHKACAALAIATIGVLTIVHFVSDPSLDECEIRKQARLEYEQKLHTLDFYPGNAPTVSEVESIPKYDRPDLARQHDVLMTMDPSTMTVPSDRLMDVFKIVDQYKEDPSRYA
ncbi:MAG: hypothetical protein HKN32_02820, partial [Flavobacteriales bacterium]|nr:hypothetical protein [Flavobacteriales bacterium]